MRGEDVVLTIEIDEAVVVVPLRALVSTEDLRFVAWDALHQVLRTYRKYIDLNDVERAIVERLSNDLYNLFDSNARSLAELVANAAG
jgi:hypothetical protein